MNAYDRFDLLRLNTINLADLLESDAVRRSKETERQLRHAADSLLPRVKQETGNREDVASLLRDLSSRWYVATGKDALPEFRAQWYRWANEAWSGLFYESKVTGGRRKPRLADRLQWLSHGRTVPDEAIVDRILGRPGETERPETLDGRNREEILTLRVAQAILDDLVASSRAPGSTVALPHLDDLASGTSVREVNSALGALLKAGESNSFIFLDPGHNPGVAPALLRWPGERRTAGPPVPYQLVFPTRPGGVATSGPGAPVPSSSTLDASAWWTSERTRDEWIASLTESVARSERWTAPPAATCRQAAGYPSLRSALIAGQPATELFDKVAWRGRPPDLPLLNQLLRCGTLEPEVETDGDYLEAELNDLATGDPRKGGDAGDWKLPGGLEVQRARSADGSRKYTLRGTEVGSSFSARLC